MNVRAAPDRRAFREIVIHGPDDPVLAVAQCRQLFPSWPADDQDGIECVAATATAIRRSPPMLASLSFSFDGIPVADPLFVALARSAWNKRPTGIHINEARYGRLIAIPLHTWDGVSDALLTVVRAIAAAGGKIDGPTVYDFLYARAAAAAGMEPDVHATEQFPAWCKFEFYRALPADAGMNRGQRSAD